MRTEEEVVAVEIEQAELVFVELSEEEMDTVAGGGQPSRAANEIN